MKASQWQALAQAHSARASALLDQRESNLIENFLWTYYRTRPVHLKLWHPGAGIELEGAKEYQDRRGYLVRDGVAMVDPQFVTAHRTLIERIEHLLSATAGRTAQFGCFGMHEWAMVYRAEEVRHRSTPLRFEIDEISAIVDEVGVRCSHFDAFRFFTPAARPLNLLQPTRESQPELEQPGCIHANMDLLKWSLKLLPMIPSSLVLDAYENSRALRVLDMQASPYDLRDYDLAPVKVETAEGRAEYQRRQRELAEESQPIRTALIEACRLLLAQQPVGDRVL